MKIRKVLLVCVSVLLVCSFVLTGCNSGSGTTTNPTQAPVSGGSNTPADVKPDVPENRFEAKDRTGNNANTPFVIATSVLDGKFSPFFATSAYDVDIEGMTQIALLSSDKDGAPIANINEPSYALSYTQEVKDKTSEYTFVLKNGLTFSDGKPVTVKDLLFSIYVLCDPLYDGSSTYYSMNIQGLQNYRTQTTEEINQKYSDLAAKIHAGGITGKDANGYTFDPVDGVTAEQQAEYWAQLDLAGARFAQEIVDYVYSQYSSYVGSEMFPGFTLEEVAASDMLKVALGMCMWGFGEEADKKLTDALGNVYDLTDANCGLTVDKYWENIVTSHEYDLAEAEDESASSSIEELVKYFYLLNVASKEVEGGGIKSISGITTGKVTGDDGVERDYLKIVIDGVDPTAIFKMGIEIVPCHYYTEGYTGTLNDFGVALNTPEFMAHLKTKNSAPLGAGPYVFKEYKDNVVTYEANDLFMLGAPKIKTLRYQVVTTGSELDAVTTGTVHYSNPSATTKAINDITGGEGDYAKMAYTLVDNDGYGYIGIQAQAIPDWNVRKAIASAINVQLAVDNFYPNGLGSVNYRTMTKVCWAYPDDPQNLFPYDATGETSKKYFTDAGYEYDAANNIMKYPAGHEKAGEQVTFKFTLPSAAQDHPAGSIFQDTQAVLAKIGVKVEIEIDENALNKLTTAYESGIQVWAAAWGSGGVDPDMFQIWCSDDTNQTPSNTGLHWLYKNGSEDQKKQLTDLNKLIVAGRSTLDIGERKAIYKDALELSTGLAVEIPTYQRKNMFAYNKDVINADTLLSGEDVTPFQSPLRNIWNVELNG